MDVLCRSELIILLIHRSLSWVMPNNFFSPSDRTATRHSFMAEIRSCHFFTLNPRSCRALPLVTSSTFSFSLFPHPPAKLGLVLQLALALVIPSSWNRLPSIFTLPLFNQIFAHICPALCKVAFSIPLCSWVWSFPLPCYSLTLYWPTLLSFVFHTRM